LGERKATSVDERYMERISTASFTVRISMAEARSVAACSAASAVAKPPRPRASVSQFFFTA
jgi:hypothetical protein